MRRLDELFERIAVEFRVRPPERDDLEPLSVGDLHRHLCNAMDVEVRQPVGGLCEIADRHLRRGLALRFGLDPESLSENDRLDDLIPRAHRSDHWQRLQSEMHLSLPPLQLNNQMTSWVGLGVLFLVGGSFMISLAALFDPVVVPQWMILLAPASLLGTVGAYYYFKPYATMVPQSCATIADAAETLLAMNYTELAKLEGGGAALSELIFDRLRSLINRRWNIPVKEIRPESQLIQDLGFG